MGLFPFSFFIPVSVIDALQKPYLEKKGPLFLNYKYVLSS